MATWTIDRVSDYATASNAELRSAFRSGDVYAGAVLLSRQTAESKTQEVLELLEKENQELKQELTERQAKYGISN